MLGSIFATVLSSQNVLSYGPAAADTDSQDPDKMPEIMRERRSIGAFYYRFPDGESGADVYDRVDNFVEHLHRKFRRPPKVRGHNRRAGVVSRTDRHGRTRADSDTISPPSDSSEAASSSTAATAAAAGRTESLAWDLPAPTPTATPSREQRSSGDVRTGGFSRLRASTMGTSFDS